MERLDAILQRHGYSLALVLGAAAILILGVLTMWRSPGPPLPDAKPVAPIAVSSKPPRHRPSPEMVALQKRQRTLVKQMVKDCRSYDVNFEGSRHFAPFPHRLTKGAWKLKANRGRLQTAELRLSTRIKKLPTPLGQIGKYEAPNIVLTVENRTDSHIAFQVVTLPSGKADCRSKGRIAQTTFVLGPREALSRTECLAGAGGDYLTVRQIEVLLIPALSYQYLIMLRPTGVLFSARTGQGHTMPKGRSKCGSVPRQIIKQGLQKGTATWADVVDFYARYSCDRYDFRIGYRRSGPKPTQSPVQK